MLSLIPLTLFSNAGTGVAAKFIGGLIFSLYLPSAIVVDEPSLLTQPTEEQVELARHVVQTDPTCQSTFTPVINSSITLQDFGLMHLSDMPPVHFVNIWATWCGPCRAELPILVRLSETSPASIELLNLGDSPEAIAKFSDEIGASYAMIGEQAHEDILQVINAQGLPYNAVFYGEQMLGLRNQAIHDEAQLSACLFAIDNAR